MPAACSSASAPSEQWQRGGDKAAGEHDGETSRRGGERAGGEQDHQPFRVKKVAGILPIHEVGVDEVACDEAQQKQQPLSSPPGLRVRAHTRGSQPGR